MTDTDFRPVSGFDLPRYAGIPTFMRLPHVGLDDPRLREVQIGLIGAPWDGGTTNRPGPRHGPRQLRDASTMIRAENGITGVRPFERARCADLGDVPPNPADLMDSLARMTAFYSRVRAAGILPLTAGGDHLCSLPILRALAAEGPLGMIHFDSHTDLFDSYFGGTHDTPMAPPSAAPWKRGCLTRHGLSRSASVAPPMTERIAILPARSASASSRSRNFTPEGWRT